MNTDGSVSNHLEFQESSTSFAAMLLADQDRRKQLEEA